MTTYDEVCIKVQRGDIIKSKKGFLFGPTLFQNYYLVREMKYLGDGMWLAKGRKKKVDVKITEDAYAVKDE